MREMPLDGRHVDRRREVIDDRVEQRLHALVLERGAAEDRRELHRARRRANERADLVDRRLLAAEVALHDRIVELDDRLDQLVTRLRDRILELVGDLAHVERLA